ncbi:MAG: hypothetical protein ACR2FN_10420 [Chitinophagaceae bacterium]
MKLFLRLTCAVIVIAFLQSCRKEIVAPPPPQNPVIGSWILTDAAQSNGYGWQPFITGFENSVFSFYANGSAQYDDGHLVLTGNWNMQTVTDGYYDEYGNYYTNTHQAFQVHAADAYSNSSIDVYFDDISFIDNNHFIATYYDGTYIDRYNFSRY